MINGLKINEAVTSGDDMVINLEHAKYVICSNKLTELRTLEEYNGQVVLPKGSTIRRVNEPCRVFDGYHIEGQPGTNVTVETYNKRFEKIEGITDYISPAEYSIEELEIIQKLLKERSLYTSYYKLTELSYTDINYTVIGDLADNNYSEYFDISLNHGLRNWDRFDSLCRVRLSEIAKNEQSIVFAELSEKYDLKFTNNNRGIRFAQINYTYIYSSDDEKYQYIKNHESVRLAANLREAFALEAEVRKVIRRKVTLHIKGLFKSIECKEAKYILSELSEIQKSVARMKVTTKHLAEQKSTCKKLNRLIENMQNNIVNG